MDWDRYIESMREWLHQPGVPIFIVLCVLGVLIGRAVGRWFGDLFEEQRRRERDKRE